VTRQTISKDTFTTRTSGSDTRITSLPRPEPEAPRSSGPLDIPDDINACGVSKIPMDMAKYNLKGRIARYNPKGIPKVKQLRMCPKRH